jgi:hypothetical protein
MHIAFVIVAWAVGAGAAGIPALKNTGSATQLMVDGKPFLMLAGEVYNSSPSTLDYMEGVWNRLDKLKLNTVLAGLSWELIEPREGSHDFSLVDGLIQGARRHHMRLVFLWFASWKNSGSSYAPGWVKLDAKRFPRAQKKNGDKWELLTPFGDSTCAADAKAFAAVMRHIRQVDQGFHTVLMMQVENEMGILSQTRDFGPLAEQAFAQPVPAVLVKYLKDHRDSLRAELRACWEKNGLRDSGTWAEVFGDSADADEIFMVWHYACYVQKVAAAGKAEYALPMYVNAWLARGDKPGAYPSGGPVSRVHDIWHAGAPAIDMLAPDVYDPDFKGVCADYARPGNPLFVPETDRGRHMAGRAFWAAAQGALGFSPFGIESVDSGNALVKTCDALDQLMPLILKYQGTNMLAGIYQQRPEDPLNDTIVVGNWRAAINYEKPDGDRYARGIIINTAPDEFIVAGIGFIVHFAPISPGPKFEGVLRVEEGRFVTTASHEGQAGAGNERKWKILRVLNGDETGGGWQAKLQSGRGDAVRILKVMLYRYE